MKISILTLFPEMFQGPFEHSIIKHAQEKGAVEIAFVNIRDFGIGTHKMIDDTPYGGGHGMVMRVDVIHEAIENTKQQFLRRCEEQFILSMRHHAMGSTLGVSKGSNLHEDRHALQARDDNKIKQWTILMSASGKPFRQQIAQEYTKLDHLIIICGHYEGIDARILEYIDEEISIGDFVLTGGEIPAMLITDAVTRLLPGVLKEGVTENESFSLTSATNHQTVEYPHYTRPQEYEGRSVPEILLSGNHQKIAAWRGEKAEEKTKKIRPDLLK